MLPRSVNPGEERIAEADAIGGKENGTGVLSRRITEARDELIRNYILMIAREQGVSLKSFIGEMEKQLIECALLVSFGNQRQASRLLGVKPTSLNEKIKRYGIRRLDAGRDVPLSRLREMLRVLAD